MNEEKMTQLYISIYENLEHKGLLKTKKDAFFSGMTAAFNIIKKLKENEDVENE